MLTSTTGFGLTEVVVPGQILLADGKDICFAPNNGQPGEADRRMLRDGFGILKPLVVAQKTGPYGLSSHETNQMNQKLAYQCSLWNQNLR
ncbi:MAG: hypothetical protein GY952_10295 [Rhodobacteraceae bacterium]|nr:hypothetical protein [Paracoccaceae bacterium]